MTIDHLRREIDRLDEQLVALLNARAGCALEIGRLKEALGIEIYQPDRERQVLDHVRQVNPGPLDDDAIARLFERIIDEARRLERIAKEGRHQPVRGGQAPRSAASALRSTEATRAPRSGTRRGGHGSAERPVPHDE